MRSWTIAFSLGILLASLIPELPDGSISLLLLIPPVLSLRLRCLVLLGAYCLGISCLLYWAQHANQSLLPAELERQDIWVRGEVRGLPERDQLNTRFELRVLSACPHSKLAACDFNAKLLQNELIQLSLYQDFDLIPGQRWQFKVRLKRPHGFQNPGGFDYEAWLWQRGIRASGYVREDSANHLLQPAAFNLDRLRQLIRNRINQTSLQQGLQYPALIRALSIGDRRA